MASLSNAQASVDATAATNVSRDKSATADEDDDADGEEYECYKVVEQVVRVRRSDNV